MVLDRVEVSFAPGEFVALMGPSGCGKTTLLKMLSGLDKPTKGQVNPPNRKNRAFIFQDYNLLESLTARRNAELTAHFSGRQIGKAWFREVFDSLGLRGTESRLPKELSGGQQQRVAVARALLSGAQFIFADEPTGALDEESAVMVLEHLRAAAQRGATVIMVTHSQQAAAMADRIVNLEAQHARMAQ